ncbi:MAG: DsbC family protein [Deltaproteobacteria bacterium]|nr:MAG: DsbC family protein [Deltaproteobacteria bacterium]
MRSIFPAVPLAALLLLFAVGEAHPFTGDGCASGACTDCHSLTRDEAVKILGSTVDNVLSVKPSPVNGLWEVAVEKAGRRLPLYVNFSKEYVITGQILQMSTKKNLTESRILSMNRIDVSQIPLSGAIVVGKKDARRRIIVFDDPNCPHCAKLHETTKEIVAKNPDVAFFVRPFPRNNDRPTHEKALSIVCAGTIRALEDGFAGKPLPKGECGSKAVDESIRIAQRFNIRLTPTMIFPDGRVVPGALGADAILSLLDEDADAPQPKK